MNTSDGLERKWIYISVRIIVFIIMLCDIVRDFITEKLKDKQRKKPLPDEVADIYDRERYQIYLACEADYKKLRLLEQTMNYLMTFAIFCSPLFAYIEKWVNGNPYLITLVTFGICWIPGALVKIPCDYYSVFVLDERYGLNRSSKREFVKDTLLDIAETIVTGLGLYMLITWVGLHVWDWTHAATGNPVQSQLVYTGIWLLFAAFALGVIVLSFFLLRRSYKFVPLPDGELKDKILKLQETSKKKVRRISVYNESAKTIEKNAFLFRFLWYREFAIADNCLNGNSEREILAVFSHEIGHLKHRWSKSNWIEWSYSLILGVLLVQLIYDPQIILSFNAWIRESFGLTVTNFSLWTDMIAFLATPVMMIVETLSAYCSRLNEYEADREAVKNGYGEDLINMLKCSERDELADVYPHPVIEFMEYSHPGLYHRIRAIREEEKRLKDQGKIVHDK